MLTGEEQKFKKNMDTTQGNIQKISYKRQLFLERHT
jgi:hypothetical protein